MKTTLLIILTFLFAVHTNAQTVENRMIGSFLYFSSGFHNININELNELLAEQAYHEFTPGMLSYGGGANFTFNNMIVGFEGYRFLRQDTRSQDDRQLAELAGGYGSINLGYYLIGTGNLLLYPMIGAGWSNVALNLNENRQPGFNVVIASPGRSSSLESRAIHLNPQIGADYIISLYNEARAGIIFGAKAGYLITPLGNTWHMNRNEVMGGPNVSAAGPYFQLKIGFGGITN
jgi:opacity protein-like surface antigen